MCVALEEGAKRGGIVHPLVVVVACPPLLCARWAGHRSTRPEFLVVRLHM